MPAENWYLPQLTPALVGMVLLKVNLKAPAYLHGWQKE